MFYVKKGAFEAVHPAEAKALSSICLVFADSAITRTISQEWFVKFEDSIRNLENVLRSGRLIEFSDDYSKDFLKQNS